MNTKKHQTRVLVIHGPNMNLLGFRTRANLNYITLDKLNRHLRKLANKHGLVLKIIQTNDESRAVNVLHRMRNKISGILLFPGPWQSSGHVISDTLSILMLPFITVSAGEKIGVLKGDENYQDEDIYFSCEKALKKFSEVIQKQS